MTTKLKPQHNHSYSGGFRNGLKQVKVGDMPKVNAELMDALKIKNRTSYSFYKKGATDLRVSQVIAIQAVFEKYGITDNIWGSI